MEEKLRDFNRKLEVIQDFLDEQKQEYMLVGSGALLCCGIPLSRFCGDVDLEVIETEENAKLFKMLQGATLPLNDEYKGEKMNGHNLPFMFVYKGIEVNVWLVEAFNHTQWVWKNNMKIATVYSVLKKKMGLQRVKDFQDLQYIIKTFSEL